jgi:hypothetical protein
MFAGFGKVKRGRLMRTLALVLLVVLALCLVGSGRVDGEIKEFSWTGYPNVGPSVNLLDCWVTIENSGDESAKFYIEVETVDGNGRKHSCGCWTTEVLRMGEKMTVGPYSIDIYSVRNSAQIKANLFKGSCLHGDLLDTDSRMLTRQKR